MKLNMFEGGRRLTKVIQISFAVAITGYALFESPYGSGTLLTSSPKAEFLDQKYTSVKCNYDQDVVVKVSKILPVTGEKNFKLCFVAVEFENKQKLIPYKYDAKTDMVSGDTKTSQNVSRYVLARKSLFEKSTLNDIKDDSDWWGNKISFVGVALLASLLACLMIEAVAKIIGWVVRGFWSVPKEHDAL